MNDELIEQLKKVYKPNKKYEGEWDLDISELTKISLNKNGKNLFSMFLERYYYMALNVIFKNDQLTRDFKCSLTSTMKSGKRTLYFSKKTFLRNFISNIDEMLEISGEEVYKSIKKEIRIKKDMYRDVCSNLEKSKFYKEIKSEYTLCNTNMSFEEFILTCRKKYTRLLSGYNAVMQFFDKNIDITKFINCFDPNQLYLYTMTSILVFNIKTFEKTGRVNFNMYCLEDYEKIIEKFRKKQPFYNSLISIDNSIWTVDDYLKEYHEFINTISN